MTRTELSHSLLRHLSSRTGSKRLCLSCAQEHQWRPRLSLHRAPISSSSRNHAQVEKQLEQIQAAPEIDLEGVRSDATKGDLKDDRITRDKLRKLRVVPSSPSYFTGKPIYTDDFIKLRNVVHRWQRLPTLSPSDAPRTAWMPFDEYCDFTGQEVIKRSRYDMMVTYLKRLNQIIPQMRPKEVVETIQRFERGLDPTMNKPNPILIDEHGRARAVGRRKASSAQVWLVEGDGKVLVNGKSLTEAFCRVHDRESVVWALKATERLDKYNVWALVQGGGTTGQAEALTLGVSKALMAHEPDLKPTLRKGECN